MRHYPACSTSSPEVSEPFSRLQQADVILDIPYYMTITVSGLSLLNPEATDYAIALSVIGE